MKKWLVLLLGVSILLALTACQEKAETSAITAAPTEPSGYGIGGDENMCKEHNMMYHAIPTDLRGCADYIESKGGDLTEEDTIITFVQWAEISKEEFIESMHWEDKLDEIALSHGNGCPYTYGQYLDAIYGDNQDLTAWVFNTPETEWPYYEGEWWNLEEDNVNWPPEGYGFGETPNEEVAPIEPAE